MTQIPLGNPGVASFENEDFSGPVGLLLSNTPPIATKVYPMEATLDVPIYSVVGLNGSGEVVPAEQGVTQAVGIVAHKATYNAPGDEVQVILHGHLNINALDWPASYNTDALKLAAFDGAPAPTSIIADVNPREATS